MLRKTFKRFWKEEDGAEVVQFVLAMPVVLQLVAVVILTMQMVYAKDVALNAASLGCRSAIIQTSFNSAKNDAEKKAEVYANNVGMGVIFKDSALAAQDGWQRGALASYTVTVETRPMLPFGFVSAPVDVSQTAVMMIEK